MSIGCSSRACGAAGRSLHRLRWVGMMQKVAELEKEEREALQVGHGQPCHLRAAMISVTRDARVHVCCMLCSAGIGPARCAEARHG
eukprot:COSAG05_NODE_17390_length_326_cov_0.669604_1_plen_85_part_10